MAGQLNVRTVKLGDSGDTTKNFLIETPAVPDGSLIIKRESGAVIATISAAGLVSIPNLNAQTWQTVTGSRVLGNTYTNSTGQPITVRVACLSTALEQLIMQPTVAGAALLASYMYAPGAGYLFNMSFVVPTGATYSVTCSKSSVGWEELR